ncbi:hypothetical protein [Subtercola vilae]|uniref:Uncharacterized protein n=1 Tax=Subtercola vilae TaxID=2056433 RepID=A0A4T2BR53_9MICO|nr:hypothetical protein [Subtercola vilae]TIH33559.1 hypothetical protein D4765_14620 [Subtercola vilae]
MSKDDRFDPQRRSEIRQLLIETVNATPRRRRNRHIILTVAVIVVAGLTATGTAAVALNGAALFGQPAPVTAAPAATVTPPPTPHTPQPTAAPTTTAPVDTKPHISTPTTRFTAPSWGAGVTTKLTGLSADSAYSLSIDSRYRGESKIPGGYFSQFSTAVVFTTDDAGNATVTWTPDVFPRNFTDSGESGYLLGSYIRVDEGSSPRNDNSTSGIIVPIAVSDQLSLSFLPIDDVQVKPAACVEPDQLIGDGSGLAVTITGLLPNEYVMVSGQQTNSLGLYYFLDMGYADDSGRITLFARNTSPDTTIPTSASIEPAQWRLIWSGNYRVTPTAAHPDGSLPLTVGNC